MTRPRSLRLVLGAVCALLLVATSCGDDSEDGEGSGSGPAPTAADLDGNSFTVSEVEGEDLVDGSTFTLVFAEGAVVAQAGCNTLRGGYTIDGGVLSVETVASTMMACSDELMTQDEWIAAFLEGGPTVALDDDVLTLTSDEVTITADRDA